MTENIFEQYYPYGLRKVNEEKWLIFNRYMLPVGWEACRDNPLQQEESMRAPMPSSSLIPAPDNHTISEIDKGRGLIVKNEAEEAEFVFLYDSDSNPAYHPECWEQYASKLQALQLSKFATGEDVAGQTVVQ